MIVFPNCKINIGLHILCKRQDNFHDLETIFYPIGLQDALEVITADKEIDFLISGIPIEVINDDNICVKAYYLLKSDFPNLPAVKIHLHKVIPSGAGLGGGSSDGAFTLLTLNKKFNLGLTEKDLITYALQLGSDCPFFIKNIPCYATGRGEILQEIKLDLSKYSIIIVNPGIHVNTAWAFKNIHPYQREQKLTNIVNTPVDKWKYLISNDFEQPVFNKYPEIQKIKELFYANEALFASMSGTGSTVYGIFEKKSPFPAIPFPSHYFVRSF